jgi:TorA maturation chaperone TorD
MNSLEDEKKADLTNRKEMMAVARQRSNIYGLLATVYRQEVTSDLLQQIKAPRFLEVVAELGLDLSSDFFQKPEEELLDELAVEYTRLFLGPGRHISPHESVHHPRDNAQGDQLWGESTVEVKAFIETAGLQYKSEYNGLPDHISVELEFMQQVTLREEQAWEEDDQDGAHYCLKIEKKFIEEHLARWIPIFGKKVIKEAELPFYQDMVTLTMNFIELEKEEIDSFGDRAG